jgi:hypothetical protein
MNKIAKYFIIFIMLTLLCGCESMGNNMYFNNGEKKAVWIAPGYRESTQSNSEYEDIYIN